MEGRDFLVWMGPGLRDVMFWDKPLAPSRGKPIFPSPAHRFLLRNPSVPNGPCFPLSGLPPSIQGPEVQYSLDTHPLKTTKGLLHPTFSPPHPQRGRQVRSLHSIHSRPCCSLSPRSPSPHPASAPLITVQPRVLSLHLKVVLPFHQPLCSWLGGWGVGHHPAPDVQGPCCLSLLTRPTLIGLYGDCALQIPQPHMCCRGLCGSHHKPTPRACILFFPDFWPRWTAAEMEVGCPLPSHPCSFQHTWMGPFGEWYQLQISLALYLTPPLPYLDRSFSRGEVYRRKRVGVILCW